MSLLEILKTKLAADQRDAQSQYAELVRRLAEGCGGPSEKAAREILERAGKTPADLESDVNRLDERLSLAAELAHLAGLQQQVGALEEEIRRHDTKLHEAQSEHSAAVGPLVNRLRGMRDQLRSEGAVRQRLRDTAPEAMRARWSGLQQEISKADRRAASLRHDIEYRKSQVVSGAHEMQSVSEFRHNELAHEIEQHRKLILQLEGQLAEAERTLAGLQASEAALMEAMLKP